MIQYIQCRYEKYLSEGIQVVNNGDGRGFILMNGEHFMSPLRLYKTRITAEAAKSRMLKILKQRQLASGWYDRVLFYLAQKGQQIRVIDNLILAEGKDWRESSLAARKKFPWPR